MTESDVENKNVTMMATRMDLCRRSARLARGDRFSGRRFLFGNDELRVAQRLNQRIARSLRFEKAFLWLGQWVKKFSYGDVTFNIVFGLMHPDHEGEFTETDRFGEEWISEEKGGGGE